MGYSEIKNFPVLSNQLLSTLKLRIHLSFKIRRYIRTYYISSISQCGNFKQTNQCIDIL